MQLKELTQFDNYFGQKVDFGFLSQGALLKLSAQEEENLKEGAVLRSVKFGERVVVGKHLKSGGQGDVYESEDPRYVIKLYTQETRTRLIEKKIKRLIEFQNKNTSICWPVDALETYGGVFVGFIMPKVVGNTLYRLTTNPPKVMKNFPQLNRLLQVNMLLEVLEVFRFLHGINVIVGDVKLQNIMFDHQYRVTLIDIDSVQVEQFPCDASTEGYDPPEVILSRGIEKYEEKINDKYAFNAYYRDFYRTLDNESFALSVLIYRFLMNGYKPYEYRDFGKISDDEVAYNDNELCIKKLFPYGVSLNDTNVSCGEKEIWSHFPSFLKEAFVNCFTYNKRYTDEEWIKLFTRYKHLLESGELNKVDPDCMDPFPEHQANYDAVKFMMTETVERNGFAMWQAVDRILKTLGDSRMRRQLLRISDVLKQKPEAFVYVTNSGKIYVDKMPEDGETIAASYRFQLVYNIGVLKKVKCEYVL